MSRRRILEEALKQIQSDTSGYDRTVQGLKDLPQDQVIGVIFTLKKPVENSKPGDEFDTDSYIAIRKLLNKHEDIDFSHVIGHNKLFYTGTAGAFLRVIESDETIRDYIWDVFINKNRLTGEPAPVTPGPG